MKKFFKDNIRNIIFSFWSLLNALMFLAMRVNYAGISKALGADKLTISETINPTTLKAFIIMDSPIVICVLMFLVFIYSLFVLLMFKNKKKAPFIVLLSLNVLFAILIIVVIILGSFDYLGFILPKFFKSLLISLLIICFAFTLFFPVANTKRTIIVKSLIVLFTIFFTVIIGYKLRFNYFTYDSVVYAVENKYQIVFSTNDNSVAWVEIDGENYYDTYAGSKKSNDLVHKIEVDQSILDNAGSYKIYAEQVNYRGPFGTFYGKTISKTHVFKKVNTSDGIKYYAISDVHESYKGALNAIKNAGDIDFVVSVGDLSSDVEGEYYANYTNFLMSKATNGEIPVVYARGNHECKGDYSEELYKYVGSKNQNFYYYYTLANGEIFGLVLDLGEDHDNNQSTGEDEWWEYSLTDDFDNYRAEQTQILKDLKDNYGSLASLVTRNYIYGLGALLSSSYNMVVCHIPIVFVNNRLDHEEIKNEWTDLLNELSIDVALYGHQHELVPYTLDQAGLGQDVNNKGLRYNINWNDYENNAGTKYSKASKEYYTNYNFVGFMVGRGQDNQLSNTQAVGTSKYTGLLINVDLVNNKQTGTYKNSKGDVVKTMLMFKDSEAKSSWESDLKTK